MPEQMKDKPQIQRKHPPLYQDDLNPDKGASQNLGQYAVSDDPNERSAAENKDLVRMFSDRFTMDELQQMHIVPPGTPLKQGAVYLDLAARDSGSFVAHGRLQARADQYLVPKNEVPYELWNRLIEI